MKNVIGLVFIAAWFLSLSGSVYGYEAFSYQSSVYNADLALSYTRSQNSAEFTLSLPDSNTKQALNLSSGLLVMTFDVDKSLLNQFNYARVYDGYQWSICEIESGNVVIPVSKDGLTALNTSGKLDFTLERMFGDFTFRSAQLKCVSAGNPVPIPNTVWLFGPTLIGFIGLRKSLQTM